MTIALARNPQTGDHVTGRRAVGGLLDTLFEEERTW